MRKQCGAWLLLPFPAVATNKRSRRQKPCAATFLAPKLHDIDTNKIDDGQFLYGPINGIIILSRPYPTQNLT